MEVTFNQISCQIMASKDKKATFKKLREAGVISDTPTVDLLGSRNNEDSYRYYGERTVAQTFANIVAEQEARATSLLGKAREDFCKEVAASLLLDEEVGASEQDCAPQLVKAIFSV